MHNLKKIEIGLLSGAVFFEIASSFYLAFEDIALLFELGVFILFVNEVPSLLNRFYRTKVFQEKVSLRLGIASSFIILYFIFSFFLGGFIIPFLWTPPISMSQFSKLVTPLFFSALFYILVMSLLVSLEVRKTSDLTFRIFRRQSSHDQIAQDKYEMEKSRFSYYFGHYYTGLIISALSFFLFCFWMVTWFLSPLFFLITILWLVHDVLSLRKRTLFDRLVGALHTSDEQIDVALGWKGLLRPLLSGAKGASISLFVLLCYGVFAFLILIFLPHPLFMLDFWASSCCWYLFLMLICLTRRLNNELHLFRRINRKACATSLPPYKNLIMTLILTLSLAWSIVRLFPRYANVYSNILLRSLSFGTNIVALVSVVIYLKRRKYKEKEIVEYKSLMNDRYHVIIVSILSSILLSVLSKTHIFLEMVLVMMVFQTFQIDLRPRIRDWKPLPYSMVSGGIIFVSLVIANLAMSLFTIDGGNPFADFFRPLFVLSVVFSLVSVIALFHAQTLRHQRLGKLGLEGTPKKPTS